MSQYPVVENSDHSNADNKALWVAAFIGLLVSAALSIMLLSAVSIGQINP